MKKLIVFFSILVVCTVCYSFERFINYSTPKWVSDIKIRGNTVLAATSGGLYRYDIKTGSGKLLESNALSPDPFLTSVVYDKKGNIWTGSRDGYLTVRNSKEVVKSFTSYFSSGWSINCMYQFGRFLIIGSNKGLSLFDTEKMVAHKNATRFKSFLSSNIYACIVHDDTLYLGMDEGIAKLSIEEVLNGNFYDPSIWDTDTSGVKPVSSFLPGRNIVPNNTPSVYYKGKMIKVKNNDTLLAGTKKIALPSAVTVLKAGGDLCWIGTEQDFFYSWDGEKLTQYTIPGLSFDIINRISIDKNGKLWVLPRVLGNIGRWWSAINSYDGSEWRYYNRHTVPDIGAFGEGAQHLGITVDSRNRVWFGFYGGQVKCFDQNENRWIKYCLNYKTNKFHEFNEELCGWGKSDAIIEDRNGYIWIGIWAQHGFVKYGSLLCYDHRYKPDSSKVTPQEAHYRRFFPEGDTYYSENYNSLSVDSLGNIIAGGTDGRIIVFDYNGDPLKNGINVKNKFTGYGMVLDMVSMPDGITKIATVEGVYDYNPLDGSLESDEDAYENTVTFEIEDGNIIWSGVKGTGIVRYDLVNGDKTVFGRNHGLISDQITDLAMDYNKGVLWVATESGLSKLTLGYSKRTEPKAESVVYPNLYSKQKDIGKRIHFENMDSESKVSIYSIDGSFVGEAVPGNITNSGAYFYWVPSQNIVPGTYIYTIHTEKIRKNGKIIITP